MTKEDGLGALATLLFVPADRPERFDKAVGTGASAIIVDLEDAVAAANRPAARAHVRKALDAGLRAFVRISTPASEDGRRDLAALAGSAPRAIVIAKTGSPEDVDVVRAVFPALPSIALIESLAGVMHLDRIAAHPGVAALALGGYDLCAELGARPTPDVLAPWRARIVFAARAAGRHVIDTPFLALDDDAGLEQDAHRAVDFGFDGKLAVHPKQIGPILEAFRPGADELERARRIVAGANGGGVDVIDGMMVDRPILLAARRVLERAGELP